MGPNSPFSLPSISPAVSTGIQDNRILPHELATSGIWPGNTTMGINGQGVQISGPTSSITLADPSTQKTSISLLGTKGYILFTDPVSGLNQIIIGKLPDGTFGLVISKPGIDVLTVFN